MWTISVVLVYIGIFVGYIELCELLNLNQSEVSLGLTHYLSGISVKRQDIDTKIPPSWQQLTQVMLQKIILEDVSSRKLDLPENITEVATAPVSEDLDSFFDSIGGEAISESGKQVHPMDVFLILYLSIDPLFQRKVLQKLDKCKLSLPLIINDPSTCRPKIFAFPFQSLSSEWKKNSKNEKAKESILFNEPMPIISFIRFGNHSSNKFSKSKILNDILGFDHDCFIHCDSPGSTKQRRLLDGTVELSWFLPRKQSKNIFSNPITFLNLRGNAAYNLKQLKFLQNVSNKIFLFFWSEGLSEHEIDSLKDLYDKSGNKIVCIFPILTNEAKLILKSCPNVKGDKQHAFVLGKGNWSQDIDTLCNLINLHSQNTPAENLASLATHVHRGDHGLELDYNESYFLEAEAEIGLILKQLIADSKENINDPMRYIKEKYFPLQCKPWEKWSEYRTESIRLKRRKDRNLEKYRSELRDKMKACRQSQVDHIIDKTRCNFLYELLRICFISSVKPFHTELLWNKLGLELNAICSENMPALYQKHKEISNILHTDLVDKLNEDERRKIEKQFLESGNNLSKSSLGIEHIIRELSQVYESFMQASLDQRKCINANLPIDLSQLPRFTANVLIQGYPIEILDGDASHVPTVWLSQVLLELKSRLGDKSMYIISILGVQSSGKSTLLNTMFGLHFAVSAGRCTKGIFMQMIPVTPDVVDILGYEYLVVLDTEGLRAPELDSKTSRFHDNELATFAIGLSHLTIINIMGETPTEMEDILPIAIHAFLRMKLTWIKPKCVFVHQNVTAAGSNEKLGPARASLIHKLNEMTCAAAKLENKSSEIKRFSDLIDFDPEEDVLYFPGLFRGDPPMAPINSSYSASAFTLKLRILQISKLNPSFKPKTISSLTTSITQLWSAILNENFIFHFKNVQEINASCELDNALSMWHFELSKEIASWQMSAINRLSNCSDIDHLLKQLYTELDGVSMTFCKQGENEILNKFFEPDNPMHEIFDQWKQSTINNFKHTRENLRILIYEKCEREGKSFLNHRKLLEGIDDIESKLIVFTKGFMEQYKDSHLTEEEIRHKFDSIWTEWVTYFGILDIPIERRNISADLYQLLFEEWDEFKKFRNLSNHDVYRDYDSYYSIEKGNFYIERDHFLLIHCDRRSMYNYSLYFWNSLLRWRKGNMDKRTRVLVREFYGYVSDISNSCDIIFHNFSSNSNYYPLLFDAIASGVKTLVHEINSSEASSHNSIWIEFTHRFQFDMTLYQCCRAIPYFERIQDDFIEKYSIQLHLSQSKKKFKSVFQSLTQGIQADNACAAHLAKIVIQGMKAYLIDEMSLSAVQSFYGDNYNRVRSKAAIQFSILEELCLSFKFYQHLKYIKHPNSYILTWVQKKITEYLSESSNIAKISDNMFVKAKHLITLYDTHAQGALDDSDDWDSWKLEFHTRISTNVKDVRLIDLDILDTYAVADATKLCGYFADQLKKEIEVGCFGWFDWTNDNLNLNDVLLTYSVILDNVLQCQACCPFCNEPCQLSSGSHEKHYCGSLHRVPAVNGRRNPFTKQMSIDQCTIGVRDDLTFHHNWKEYRFREFSQAGPQFENWRILGDDAIESKYWQWFTCQFERALLRRYRYRENSDLCYWKNYSQREVLLNLKEQFDMISP